MRREPRLRLLLAAIVANALVAGLITGLFVEAPPPPRESLRAPAATRILAYGEEAYWTPNDGPASYGADDIELRLRAIETEENGYEAVVRRPGRAPLAIRAPGTPSFGCCTVSIGRLDRSGERYAMVQTFTGGLHCCFRIQIALPDGPNPRVLEVGAFDAAPNLSAAATGVRDFDGDGRVDFVFGDDAFLYRFSSYAGSSAPLLILNVIDGRVVNVSAARRYRRLHLHEMEYLRPACRNGEWDFRHAACAAYVASAARIGRLDVAWREMLASYHREEDARLNPFPDELREFLAERGYIEPTRRLPADRRLRS